MKCEDVAAECHAHFASLKEPPTLPPTGVHGWKGHAKVPQKHMVRGPKSPEQYEEENPTIKLSANGVVAGAPGAAAGPPQMSGYRAVDIIKVEEADVDEGSAKVPLVEDGAAQSPAAAPA